jgi:hypothetical protein
MRIAREYGARLKSPLLKPGMLERLVQDYPSHGFVIDKEEAEKYFSTVGDLTIEELNIGSIFADDVRLPKEEPESLDILGLVQRVRTIQQVQAQRAQNQNPTPTAEPGKGDGPVPIIQGAELGQVAEDDDTHPNSQDERYNNERSVSDDGSEKHESGDGGHGSPPAEAQPTRPPTDSPTAQVNGSGNPR